jgi:hypothetical protein
MNKTEERIERREHERFQAPRDAFVAFFGPRHNEVGRIIDISVRGLAFRYISNQGSAGGLHGLNIFSPVHNFYLDNVQFKTISDVQIAKKAPSGPVRIRRGSVEFGELEEQQVFQLEYFIHKYIMSEV